MRMPRAEPRRAVLLGAVAVVATGALLATGSGAGQAPAPATGAESWLGLVASRPSVALAQRVIVVLKRRRSRSVSRRPAVGVAFARTRLDARCARGAAARACATRRAGDRAPSGLQLQPCARRILRSRRRERRRAARARPRGRRRLSGPRRLSGGGLDSGVCRFRVPVPAFASPARTGAVSRSRCSTPRVDAAVPYLRGRVRDGIDLVGPGGPSQLERHGTEMAGLLVGGAGVATGASVLPIRVAGSQPDGHAALGRVRAQRPARRRARPRGRSERRRRRERRRTRRARSARRAVRGLRRLRRRRAPSPARSRSTRSSSRRRGTTAPPDRATATSPLPARRPPRLTVGAMDTRPRAARAQVVIRSGLATLFAGTLPLAGAVAVPARTSLEIAAPRSASRLTAFFSPGGASLVAGRAAFVLGGRRAARGRDERGDGGRARGAALRPPAAPGRSTRLRRSADGSRRPCRPPSRALCFRGSPRAPPRRFRFGARRGAANPDRGHVTSFSSTGLAFDGRVKPNLVASGVGLTTAIPARTPTARRASSRVNGSSAAAAVIAGAAALLAQARPRSVPRRSPGCSRELHVRCRTSGDDAGRRLVDVGAAAMTELSEARRVADEPRHRADKLDATSIARDARSASARPRLVSRRCARRTEPHDRRRSERECRLTRAARGRRTASSSCAAAARRPRPVGDRTRGSAAARRRTCRSPCRNADDRRGPSHDDRRHARDRPGRASRRRARRRRTARASPRRAPRPLHLRADRARADGTTTRTRCVRDPRACDPRRRRSRDRQNRAVHTPVTRRILAAAPRKPSHLLGKRS